MPLVIDNPSNQSCSLPECIEALGELGFDADDPASIAAAADWLRRLANNRSFLGDLLVDRLAGRGGEAIASEYGPQAIVLSRQRVSARRDLAIGARPGVPDQRRRQFCL